MCTHSALVRTSILSRDASTPLSVAPVKHFRQHSQGRPIATSIAAPSTTGSIRVRVREAEVPIRSARGADGPTMFRVSSSERIATDPTETESVAAKVLLTKDSLNCVSLDGFALVPKTADDTAG